MNEYNIHGGIVTIPGNAQIERLEMHGGVINLYGRTGRLIHSGGIINRFDKKSPSEPRILFRDRIVYKDRVRYVPRDKIVYKPRDPEEVKKELQQLRGQAKFYMEKCDALEQENLSLVAELEQEDRVKLTERIAELENKLKAAKSRESQLKHRAKEAERRAAQTQAHVWDEFRPTKEACRLLYENLKAFLDCETDADIFDAVARNPA